MFIPEISASKVAALIGLNKYQSTDETKYDIMCKDKLIKARIADIEKAGGRRPLAILIREILSEAPIADCVQSGLQACRTTSDIPGVLQNVEKQARLILSLRHAKFEPALQEFLVQEVRGKVAKQRGIHNEAIILDAYETQRDVKVTQRNTKTVRKEYGKFRLIGRTDGFVESENRIVDSKDRTRMWDEVPLYDEIQLRCYMDMTGASEAELVERFPNGQVRHTKFLNDSEKWKAIQVAIEEAVADMNAMLRDEEDLKRMIYKNTVCIAVNDGDSSAPRRSRRISDKQRLNL